MLYPTVTVWLLVPVIVTVKVAVPAASLTVTSLTASVGAASLSVIVIVPLADAFDVVPATAGVAVKLNVSLTSLIVSLLIGVRTNTLVAPTAIVTDGPSTQLNPPSIDV